MQMIPIVLLILAIVFAAIGIWINGIKPVGVAVILLAIAVGFPLLGK